MWDDNHDFLPYASYWPYGFAEENKYAWVTGSMDFDPNNPSNWDVNQDITKSRSGIIAAIARLSGNVRRTILTSTSAASKNPECAACP
ncbi:MAG: hypothetical protein WDM80_17790 [Limisphaerales bacterium]